MAFKRFVYCTIAFLTFLSLGILASPNLVHFLNLPHTPKAMFIVSIFSGFLGALISYAISYQLQKLTSSVEPKETSLQQQWAWLKPAGLVARSPYPLNKEQVIIGRDVAADVLLCNDSVSRRHAEVLRTAEGWWVRDLESSNGTFVNGLRIDGEVQLGEGDVITVGDVNLTFEGPRRPIPESVPEPVTPLPSIDPEAMGLDLDTQITGTVPTMPVAPLPPEGTQVWSPDMCSSNR